MEIKLKSSKKTIQLSYEGKQYELTYIPTGAGSSLNLMELQRQEEFLGKKIAVLQNSATTEDDFNKVEKDLVKYNDIQNKAADNIRCMFEAKDKEAKQWLETVEYDILAQALNDISEQIDNQ